MGPVVAFVALAPTRVHVLAKLHRFQEVADRYSRNMPALAVHVEAFARADYTSPVLEGNYNVEEPWS
jgi:hypothetical protein